MPDAEGFHEMNFPLAGIDTGNGFNRQMPRQMNNQDWGRTCREGVNVRGFEQATQRARGGSRAGLSRYVTNPVVADWVIQELAVIVIDDPSAKT